ncbi:MAG: PAS domain S-box protein [Holophagales bacterium]|jgi:two-component system sensor histidine kinase PilS (NtrC family)|nr:PAS domain S-box protein [Holophagales bacterium]
MDRYTEPITTLSIRAGGPFLPLALRFAASFSLLVLHLALEWDLPANTLGEWIYVLFLSALFVESAFESARSTVSYGLPFAVPNRAWILLNLFLLCFLVTLLVSFHGVDQAGLAALYVFPVLASAFYVGITTIIGVGAISIAMYAFCVVLFSSGAAPPFGHSSLEGGTPLSELVWLIAFTALQIMIATLVVVTIRRRLETLGTNLRKSAAVVDELSALYRNVVESMRAGLVTTDLKGALTSANPSAERILQSKLVLGQPFKMLDAINLVMQGATSGLCRFERSLTTPGGVEIIVGGTASSLMDAENQPTGFLLLFDDLTDMKAMEARMRLNERLVAIGELSSELAHEMRTPLASVQGCVQILRKPNCDKAIVDKVMTILIRESERVGAVVSDFLEMAKPRDLKLGPLWLPGLLEEVQSAWNTDPRFAELPLEIETPPEIWIHGDALACHQILTNLLSNSRKAVRGAAQPIIKLTQIIQNDKLEMIVADNGVGMDKSQIGNLFLPFRSGFSEGTGIGMSLVFQLTQRMGWEIHVSSEVGVGTAIRLIIPIDSNSK